MGNNRFMVVSMEKMIVAMNPSYVEQKEKSHHLHAGDV